MAIKRQVFYSFHYEVDSWRASQVRKIGVVEGNRPATDNVWETVKKGGSGAIERWINDQMKNRSCTVVLVGSKTANRKWINYEIAKSWKNDMGVVGVRIHGLKNENGCPSSEGGNPFDHVTTLGNERLSSIIKCYSPVGSSSQEKRGWISRRLSDIIEEAIKIRKQHG